MLNPSKQNRTPQRCNDCKFCATDYLFLATSTYRVAVCQRDIVNQVVVDAGAWRDCSYAEPNCVASPFPVPANGPQSQSEL